MKDTLLGNALRKDTGKRAPFWFMRQAGRYLPEYREVRARCKGFLDLCYTPDLAVEVTLQPIRRFDMDAAIIFSDILVVPHALGTEVSFVEGEGPKLTPFSEADLAHLSLARVEGHIQPVLRALRQVSAELGADKALIGFAGAPWTVACYMIEGGGSREFEHARRFALEHPKAFARLIALLEDATILYLKAQIAAGADVIQLFDSWAGILPHAEFETWVIDPTKRIAQALKQAYPQIPMIGFPRLAGTRYADYAKTGVAGVSVDFTADLPTLECEAVKQGNLDPYLLAYDLPKALDESKRLIHAMQGEPFIFNLGHGMLPQTPVKHVQALCDFLQSV